MAITWAGDLAGSADNSQIVVAVSGTAGKLRIASTAPTLEWATATATPKLYQADDATASATGDTLTIQAQNATGTSSTGGGLTLATGTGTSVDGNMVLANGATTRLTIAPTVATLGANAAAAGVVRLSNASDICWRNAANGADIAGIGVDSSNVYQVGATAAGVQPNGVVFAVNTGHPIYLRQSGSNQMQCVYNAFTFASTTLSAAVFRWGAAITQDCVMGPTARTVDLAPATLIFKGQNAYASAATQKTGRDLSVQGGARASTSGKRGGFRIALNNDPATDIMIEGCDIQPSATKASRVLSLCKSVPQSTATMPSDTGDLVIYLGSASTLPTANPVGGGILYVDAGALKYRGSSGTVTTLGVV